MTSDLEIHTQSQAAEMLNISVRTLGRMVADGTGPRRVRVSERRVGYLRSDLEQWLKARTEAGETAD
nr:helix-turn-helix domain-containing protein [uncultured Acidocella sp.]